MAIRRTDKSPERIKKKREIALKSLKKIYYNEYHVPKRYLTGPPPTPEQLKEYREEVIKPEIEKLEELIGKS